MLSRLPAKDDVKEDNKNVTMLPSELIRAGISSPPERIVVPAITEVRRGILRLYHDHTSAGHPGRDETLQKVQQHYYWPRMKEWIADYVKGCSICQQSKILTHRSKVPLYKIPTVPDARPFQRVAMDLITGLPPRQGFDAILTIVDQGCS
jgi:hypothetical protein